MSQQQLTFSNDINNHIWCLHNSCVCSYEEFNTQQDLNIHYKLFHTNINGCDEEEYSQPHQDDVIENTLDTNSKFLKQFKYTFGQYTEIDITYPLWFKKNITNGLCLVYSYIYVNSFFQ